MKNIINNAILILLTTTFFNAHSVKINGVDINEIAKPGQVIHYQNHEANNILLTYKKNGDVEIGYLVIDNIQEINERYSQLVALKDKLAQYRARDELHLEAKIGINLNACYATSGSKIILYANNTIKINDTILESKDITLIANQINIRCFINAQNLQIEPNNKGCLLEIIKFNLNKNPDSTAPFIQSDINFKDLAEDQTILVTNTENVWLMFSPKAFAQ